jgi:ParB family chromosome partitioning protein
MSENLTSIPLDCVFPNPDQPRKNFDPEKLEELAMSIRQYGVLEPIVVTPRKDRYMIIGGERRFRASLLAGLKDVPVRIIEADDALVEELSLLENIQREDLNIIEEARAFQALLDRGWSKEDLARKMGFKQVWRIDERTSLLNLSPDYQRLVVDGTIGHSQAFEMSRVSPGKQSLILRKIKSGELGTYNKLRSFVDGLILVEQQEALFAFQSITAEEKKSIEDFEGLLKTIEKFIKATAASGQEHFKKASFHSQVSPERLDLIIQHLMKLRKLVLTGTGVKDAIEEAA